jgi:non-ribosomal peptide synthetase component E (peptide arylation enzyme)
VNIAQHLEDAARRHAGRTALIAGDRQWTDRRLDEAVSVLAGGLAELRRTRPGVLRRGSRRLAARGGEGVRRAAR